VEEDIAEDAEAEEDSRPVAKAAPKHLKSPVNGKRHAKKFQKKQVDPASRVLYISPMSLCIL
jgi:hypothetical protein